MRKIICDRCGAEITGDRIGYVEVNWRAASDNSFLNKNPYEHADFCLVCMSQIAAFIDDVNLKLVPEEQEVVPEAVEDPVQEEPEEPVVQIQKTPSKKSVDKGKVGALSKAGWSNAKIADEMGVSSERIRQILKELEVKNG